MAYDYETFLLSDVGPMTTGTNIFKYTSSDTLSTILTDGYFAFDPDNSQDVGNIAKSEDFILIKGSDGADLVYIQSLNPTKVEQIGGGSGTVDPIYDAIIDTASQYQTIGAAISAGKRKIALLISVTDEDAIVLTNDDYLIDIFDCTWTFKNNFNCNNTSPTLTLRGNGGASTIIFEPTSSKDFLDNTGANTNIYFYSLRLENNSGSLDNCPIPVTLTETLNEIVFDNITYIHNVNTVGGSYLSLINNKSILSNCVVSGTPGTGTVIYLSNGAMANNIILNNVGVEDNPINYIISMNSASFVSNLYINTNGTGVYYLKANGYLSDSVFTNSSTGRIDLLISDDRSSLSNVKTKGSLNVTSSQNLVNGCLFASEGGGSSNTITLGAIADKNIVTSNFTDVAISNSGSDNELANNIVI